MPTPRCGSAADMEHFYCKLTGTMVLRGVTFVRAAAAGNTLNHGTVQCLRLPYWPHAATARIPDWSMLHIE